MFPPKIWKLLYCYVLRLHLKAQTLFRLEQVKSCSGGQRCVCVVNLKPFCDTTSSLPCHHGHIRNLWCLFNKKKKIKNPHFHQPCINCVTCTEHMYDVIFSVLPADINECKTGRNTCANDTVCFNLDGGYDCRCPHGHNCTGDCIHDSKVKHSGQIWVLDSDRCSVCSCQVRKQREMDTETKRGDTDRQRKKSKLR